MIKKYFPFATFLLLGSISYAQESQDIKEQVNRELNQAVKFNFSPNSLTETAKAGNRLIKLGKPAVPSLMNALNNPELDVSVRWMAAQVLGEIGDEQAIPVLIATMTRDNQNQWLREVCSYSLAQTGAASAELLLSILSNQSEVNVASAYVARTLGRLGIHSAEASLIRIAESALEAKSHSYALDREIVDALGRLGSEKSVSVLSRLQGEPKLKESSARAIQNIHSGVVVVPPARLGKIYVYSFSGTCSRTEPESGVIETIPCPVF